MQSRYQSFIEALLNVLIGYVVALTSQLLIFPLFWIKVSFAENLLAAGSTQNFTTQQFTSPKGFNNVSINT